MQGRLGLNVHRDQWPTTSLLKGYEAAGWAWVQAHTPPRAMLAERERCRRHARALRAAMEPTGLRLLLHGPDDLSAGTIDGDRALDGLLEHAAEAGAEFVVYHGLNFPVATGAAAARLAERARAEEQSLERAARRAGALGIRIAVENLCPVHPSPPTPDRICHDALAVRDLVRRIGSPAVGMLLDVGHAHVMANLARDELAPTIRAVLDDVILFHVHDNLGARRHGLEAPGLDPLKLDLHLPPGNGSLPWDRVAPLLRDHDAPLMHEIERSFVSDLAALRSSCATVLHRGAIPAAA